LLASQDHSQGEESLSKSPCESACEAAFNAAVGRCNQVLTDCLVTSQTPEEKQQCHEHFQNCMRLAKQAFDECVAACSD
jgi:hypothetical protein